ncbi:putative ABC transporter permease [Flavonifractor plautii]|uniref:putative ABC transporter permease n=1 Tax=Flavonifractor plautii TaxID=292800 RepID=UPI00189DB369
MPFDDLARTLLAWRGTCATGLVLNVWLGLGVWDYSHLAGNILGQICPQFTLLWLVLSVVGIVILDWMRYAVEGGEKPRYT